MKIDAPGIYEMTAADYHALELPQPALSASIIKILLNQSPKHAWYAHPALNPSVQRTNKQMFDDGEGAHALFLEGRDNIVVIEAENYRTNAAKELRDQAYADGQTPMLRKDYDDAIAMCDEAHKQLAECSELMGYTLAGGKSEQTIVCQIEGVWCKGRIDHHENDFTFLLDYKTSSASAEPRAATRRILDQQSGDIQSAFYRLLVCTVTGKTPEFFFMPQENEPPYACSIIRATPGYLTLGESKVHTALAMWKQCLATNNWPGYSGHAYLPELTPWVERSWLEQLSEGEYVKTEN